MVLWRFACATLYQTQGRRSPNAPLSTLPLLARHCFYPYESFDFQGPRGGLSLYSPVAHLAPNLVLYTTYYIKPLTNLGKGLFSRIFYFIDCPCILRGVQGGGVRRRLTKDIKKSLHLRFTSGELPCEVVRGVHLPSSHRAVHCPQAVVRHS